MLWLIMAPKKDEESLTEAIQGALDGDGALAGSQLLLAGN